MRLEDIFVGQSAELGKTITEADVVLFAGIRSGAIAGRRAKADHLAATHRRGTVRSRACTMACGGTRSLLLPTRIGLSARERIRSRACGSGRAAAEHIARALRGRRRRVLRMGAALAIASLMIRTI